MSFASDFKAALREESEAELRRMAAEDGWISAFAHGELARREREKLSAEWRELTGAAV